VPSALAEDRAAKQAAKDTGTEAAAILDRDCFCHFCSP
jgi:hypothetical protein